MLAYNSLISAMSACHGISRVVIRSGHGNCLSNVSSSELETGMVGQYGNCIITFNSLIISGDLVGP